VLIYTWTAATRLPCLDGTGEAERHGRRLVKAITHSIGHHLLNHKLLRDLGDVGNPLYSLVVEKMGHGRPTATA
jgi:hypothetical protein